MTVHGLSTLQQLWTSVVEPWCPLACGFDNLDLPHGTDDVLIIVLDNVPFYVPRVADDTSGRPSFIEFFFGSHFGRILGSLDAIKALGTPDQPLHQRESVIALSYLILDT
jgi:hypothetical protein